MVPFELFPEKEKYLKIIKEYIIKNKDSYFINDISNVKIDFLPLGGGMNQNYLIEVDNHENSKKYKFFFRYFGDLVNEYFNRRNEVEIIKKLGEDGFGPKLLEFDYENQTFRIDEYLDNTKQLDYEKIFEERVLNDLINILNKYSKISDIYKYDLIQENSNYQIKLDKTNYISFTIENNIYESITRIVYKEAKENFKKFYSDYHTSKINNSNINTIINDKNMNKIKSILDDFINLFSSFFNKKGFLVLNHNDFYQLNILINENTNKLYVIDNEFSCLNLIGFDIVWYLLMSLFKYEPEYEYYPDSMNYTKFYEIYQKYLEVFIKTNLDWINEDNERFDYIELLKTEKYFCSLLCIANLYSFVFCLNDLDFQKESDSKNNSPFFINVLNRIQLFEFSYEEFKKK